MYEGVDEFVHKQINKKSYGYPLASYGLYILVHTVCFLASSINPTSYIN